MSFLPYKTPSTICVSGCSGSGKTKFIYELLRNRNEMFDNPIDNVVYCYNVWQDLFDEMLSKIPMNFHQNLIKPEELKHTKNTLVVLDDLQQEICKDKNCEKIFTQFSHHNNITVLYVVQNLFYPGMRTLTLNTHYFVLFKNLRDQNQIRVLARQCGLNNRMLEAYKDATSNPYGYLNVDLSPHQQEDKYRLSTNIFPYQYTILYC
jgi:hypothetical protein